ncbi:MAG: hypothetical protein ACRDQW_13250 [Haloechinothrix sp.]
MSKKRYLLAFGAAGVVFAGVFGAAAALDVNGESIQAGSDYRLACDTDGVTVDSYLIDAEPPAVSNGVKVVDIDEDCVGEELFAVILDGSGAIIGKGSADIASPQTIISWANPVRIRAINSIHLSID